VAVDLYRLEGLESLFFCYGLNAHVYLQNSCPSETLSTLCSDGHVAMGGGSYFFHIAGTLT
jgi:hypothetical protein